MYYYIFESSSQNNKIADFEDKIRDFVADLGIVGEMTSPSHARSLDYLISQAILKKYSTIVAVGDVKHITAIAAKLVGLNIVLGIIPIENMPEISKLLNLHSWKEAAEALKNRRYIELSLGVIDPGAQIFITSCQIQTGFRVKGAIQFPKYLVENIKTPITIGLDDKSGRLVFEFSNPAKRSFFKLFDSSKKSEPEISIFHEKKGQITTSAPAPVLIDHREITTTPITISLHSKKIKIIVGRHLLFKE